MSCYVALPSHRCRGIMPSALSTPPSHTISSPPPTQVSLPSDPSVLKVAFVRRSEAQTRTARNLTNEPELLARCNAPRPEDLPPPAWGTAVRSYFCFPYIFGADPLMDVWVMRQVGSGVGRCGRAVAVRVRHSPCDPFGGLGS